MSAQSDTENVLRDLHVLLSRGKPYAGEPGKVVVDRQQVLDLLSELNTCIGQIMDEYELTERSRRQAEREFRRQSDQMIWDAGRKAEDVYAASVLYMDDALNGITDIMRKANAEVGKIYADLDARMKKEERRIKDNQSELKSQLQDMVDTEKYLKIIDDSNKERERLKNAAKQQEKEREKEKEKSVYSNRQTQIKVNQAYLDRMGMNIVEEAQKPVAFERGLKLQEEEEPKKLKPEVRLNLDADYFKWKQAQQNMSSGKENTEGYQKKWKNMKRR